MATQFSPSAARQNFFSILNEVNIQHEPIEIRAKDDGGSAVIISFEDWRSIRETLVLEQTGVMNTVREREQDDSGFFEDADFNWDEL